VRGLVYQYIAKRLAEKTRPRKPVMICKDYGHIAPVVLTDFV